jgi:coenzyme F420-reducing hydrogenase delta subunit
MMTNQLEGQKVTPMTDQKSHKKYVDGHSDIEFRAPVEEFISNPDRAERVLRAIAANVGENEPFGLSKHAPGQTIRSNDRNWAATLELVKEACDSIRISEERVASLEVELEQVSIRSRDDLKNMAARLMAAQEEIKLANSRVKAMELELAEVEDWASKINEAVVDGFGPYVRRMQIGIEDLSADS